jgi:glycine/D-amino acid oxidase-like deaminating enzyme
MSEKLFTSHFKQTPFWWEEAPRPAGSLGNLPDMTEVLIVGSGYTGLSAALTLARHGKQVTILEADVPGYGASSRNAGACGRTFRFTFGELMSRFGVERAIEIYRELYEAHNFTLNLMQQEGIACHARQTGRYIYAASPRHFQQMIDDERLRRQHLPIQDVIVPPQEQENYATCGPRYGARLIPDWNGIHPGLYQLELLRLAEHAGVRVLANTAVTSIEPKGKDFVVQSTRGTILARHVVVGTNGYTGAATPYLQRRVVPFPAYMAATEPIGTAAVQEVIPGGQIVSDSLENMFYVRAAPAGDRLLFGGLTGSSAPDLRAMGVRLHAELVKHIPSLKSVRLSHVWTGKCSANFDLFPHIGEYDGIHYGGAYTFAGVSMGTFFGHKIALRVLGLPGGSTAFDNIRIQARPYYWGRAWFLPLAVAQMNLQDKLGL